MHYLANIHYQIDSNDWNNHIISQKFTNAYQMANFYAPHCVAFDSEQFYIDIQTSLGNIVGQLTGVIHYKNFMSSNSGPVIIWHHGPIIHDFENYDLILKKILESLDQIAHEKKINFIQGSSLALAKPFTNKLFTNYGYALKPWITYISKIDKNSNDFLSSLHNKLRYDIRKGEKNNFTFEIAKDKYALDEYSELKLSNNKNKNEIFKRNIIFREKRWELSIKNGWEKVYLARLNDVLVGGMANFTFNNNVIQHTITNSSNIKLQSGSFLTWNAIKSSIEDGFVTYDMGGANPTPSSQKEKGIKHFKSKWNGTEYQYFLYTKVFNKTKMKFNKVIKNPSIIINKFSNFFKN